MRTYVTTPLLAGAFSSEEAKANFMKNPKENLAKAKESYKEFKDKS